LSAAGPELRERLRAAWAAVPAGRLPAAELISQLVVGKYATAEWVHRR
jgi:hypothetical protein